MQNFYPALENLCNLWIKGRLALGFLAEIDEAQDRESLKTLKRNFGLVPRVYRAQLLRPDLVDGEVQLLDQLLFAKGALTRAQKEFILLAVSAENNNSYFPALHGQTLQFLGVKPEKSQQVTIDHRAANLPEPAAALVYRARRRIVTEIKLQADRLNFLNRSLSHS